MQVVFSSSMLKEGAQYREIESYLSTSDFGIETEGNDLLLIKIKGTAPEPWRPVELPLSLLPTKTEQAEAERKGSPFFPSGIGFPEVSTYGYGQQNINGENDIAAYSAGTLKKINVQVWNPQEQTF